jgi:hypothetical protein
MDKRHAEIEGVIRDYIEGWYCSDAERMTDALHPDLAKRGYHVVEATDRSNLVPVTAASMVEYTRAGLGKLEPGIDPDISIKIFDVRENTASAVVQSIRYVDHVHLAYCNGRWQIINVLWESSGP